MAICFIAINIREDTSFSTNLSLILLPGKYLMLFKVLAGHFDVNPFSTVTHEDWPLP